MAGFAVASASVTARELDAQRVNVLPVFGVSATVDDAPAATHCMAGETAPAEVSASMRYWTSHCHSRRAPASCAGCV